MALCMALPVHAAGQETFAHPAIYLLADHLDGVLAAGEDLLAARCYPQPRRDGGGAGPALTALPAFVAHLRALERTTIMHGLQARQRARDVRKVDRRFGPLAALFLAGTMSLVDAASELGDATECDFRMGDDTVCFFRSRAMIAADAGSLERMPSLAVTESFRIAGCVELGPLLDLVATFAHVLDQHYELYSEDAETIPELESSLEPLHAADQPAGNSLQQRLLKVSTALASSAGLDGRTESLRRPD